MLSSRKGLIERRQAMDTAKNMMTSKVGVCVLSTNTHEDRLLDKQYAKIDKELKRKQMHLDQMKKQFLQTQTLYTFEPTIIVERPPSPEAWMHYESLMEETPSYKADKGYMKPLKSKIKAPSNLPTIDAFTVRSKKKVNLWEEALTDLEHTRFRSTVPPSAKLTEEERFDLQRGWQFHRPQSRLQDMQKEAEEAAKMQKNKSNPYTNRNKKKGKKRDLEALLKANAESEDQSSIFVTQMNTDKKVNADGANAKTVSFSKDVKIHPLSAAARKALFTPEKGRRSVGYSSGPGSEIQQFALPSSPPRTGSSKNNRVVSSATLPRTAHVT